MEVYDLPLLLLSVIMVEVWSVEIEMMHFDSEKYTSFNLLQSILVHFQPNSSFINNMFAYVRILICLVINAQKICSFVHLVQGKIDV